ncbi:MAG: LON peptidase substrate-binding domain-containing protein [Acidobacteria bacterium]|nr:LON peptidase substrate-binding domain-containing protein [Acidobacteriota bacterium]
MSLLPLFPLPNVVLFPGVLLPLHIFEPRYREMVADALASDRLIGMVLLRPGWNADYDGRPPIHAIGCSGVIVHAVRLDDGRYNIVLRGLERFRVIVEDPDRAYRRATIMPLPEPPVNDTGRPALKELRHRIEDHLGLAAETSNEGEPPPADQLAAMPDAEFVNAISQHLDLEPIEKQALLERETVHARAEALLELLDMRRLAATMPPGPGIAH